MILNQWDSYNLRLSLEWCCMWRWCAGAGGAGGSRGGGGGGGAGFNGFVVFVCIGHEVWFFEPKREWGRERYKGKEYKDALNLEVVKDSVVPSVTVTYGNTQKDLNDDPMAMEVQSPLVDQTNAGRTGGGSHPPLRIYGTTPVGNIPGNSLEETTILGSFLPLPMQVTNSDGNAHGKSSYANVTGIPTGKKLNIHTLFTSGGNGIDVVVLVEFIRAISDRFANTTYGFFFGKKVAYPVFANYVRNTWAKYGLVKLHGVPVTAFSEDVLSAIATKLGTPLMLYSYTFDMCMQSWGRSSYARVMVELRADVELKDNIVMAMPKITREGHYTCNVRVEYEWKPPSSSANKKKGVEPTIEVSNSIPFDVLNSVDNDGELMEFGTMFGGVLNNCLLEQLRDSYLDNDDYDPYDDDMYENHDLSEHLQSICDDLDITVRGRKKK
ncbi:hypothetical protein Tco_0422329 [Tanacetum coccineum]